MSPSQNQVQVGDKAPGFTLPSQSGTLVSLNDFIGVHTVVLYFYPKDNTQGCTAEACAFRDSYEVLKQAGAEVIGVSSDSVESHQQFGARYQLPFILVSDNSGLVRRLYGVHSLLGLLPGRVTYIIDKQGIVQHIFTSNFAPQQHVNEALKIVHKLESQSG